jgi:hypothetical protein
MTPNPNPVSDISVSLEKLPSLPKIEMNKEKIETKTVEKDKIDKTISKLFAKNMFKTIALVGGPHWELDKEELQDVSDALHPVMNKHWDLLAKYFAEINLALTLARVCVPKVKQTVAIMAEKKKKEAEKLLEKKLLSEGYVKKSQQKLIDGEDEEEEIEEDDFDDMLRKNAVPKTPKHTKQDETSKKVGG